MTEIGKEIGKNVIQFNNGYNDSDIIKKYRIVARMQIIKI